MSICLSNRQGCLPSVVNDIDLYEHMGCNLKTPVEAYKRFEGQLTLEDKMVIQTGEISFYDVKEVNIVKNKRNNVVTNMWITLKTHDGEIKMAIYSGMMESIQITE